MTMKNELVDPVYQTYVIIRDNSTKYCSLELYVCNALMCYSLLYKFI